LPKRLSDDFGYVSRCWVNRRYNYLTLRRASTGEAGGELAEASEPRRSASLTPSGIAGTLLSAKTLVLCELYFWWNGEGMLFVVVDEVDVVD
jgi:hypothetical protein